MRIKVKTLKTLVFAGILAIGGIFAGGMISKKASTHRAYGEAEQEYCCGDVTFGDTTTDGSGIANKTYSTAEELKTVCKSSAALSMDNLDFTIQTNDRVYFKGVGNPFRLGSGDGGGSFTITLNNGWSFDKINLHVACYGSDSDVPIKVNGVETKANSSKYNVYTFDFNGEKKSSVTIETTTKKKRVYVGQVTFRLYQNI